MREPFFKKQDKSQPIFLRREQRPQFMTDLERANKEALYQSYQRISERPIYYTLRSVMVRYILAGGALIIINGSLYPVAELLIFAYIFSFCYLLDVVGGRREMRRLKKELDENRRYHADMGRLLKLILLAIVVSIPLGIGLFNHSPKLPTSITAFLTAYEIPLW
jgi:hypothetical protein